MQEPQEKRIRNATARTASIVGLYAGLLGAVHGGFETLQGNLAPSGIGINAVGMPCRADAVWHACLPAMTVIPNFLTTGILAIIVSLIAFVWATFFIERKNGGWVLVLLSSLMLIVGGGFIPTFTGILAGAAAINIDSLPIIFRTRLSIDALRFLSKLWPWVLIAFMVWSIGGWILGYFFNQAMLNLSFVLFFFCNLGLPLLAVGTGFARDALQYNQAAIV